MPRCGRTGQRRRVHPRGQHIELPSDIDYLHVEVPGAPLAQAKSPAILVDQDIDRYGAAAEVVGLAERLQMPVAMTGPAKAVIDETFPYYAGIYNGKGSDPRTREALLSFAHGGFWPLISRCP